jgi:hypothetical protein
MSSTTVTLDADPQRWSCNSFKTYVLSETIEGRGHRNL